jgi:hypothetical protein
VYKKLYLAGVSLYRAIPVTETVIIPVTYKVFIAVFFKVIEEFKEMTDDFRGFIAMYVKIADKEIFKVSQ